MTKCRVEVSVTYKLSTEAEAVKFFELMSVQEPKLTLTRKCDVVIVNMGRMKLSSVAKTFDGAKYTSYQIWRKWPMP